MNQPSKNSLCLCGSGKKYKRCCGARIQPATQVSINQEYVQKLFEQALDYRQQGDFKRAELMVDQALMRASTDSGLLGFKGWLVFEQGRTEEAEKILGRAIALNPDDSRLYNFLGQVLASQEQLLEAERVFGRAITLDPGFMEAWYNIGSVQLKRHRPDEALVSFRRALKWVPNDGELHVLLAKALYLKRDPAAARLALMRAKELGAWSPVTQLWLCLVLRAEGNQAEADSLEKEAVAALEHVEDVAGLFTEFGRNETYVGRQDEAEYWLEKAITLAPDDPAAYIEIASARKFTQESLPLIERMESLAQSGAGQLQRGLEFALGKVHADLKEYDLAFVHYRAGNDLVRKQVPFDRAKYVAQFDHLNSFFTSESFQNLPSGCESDVPILIVGTPRSGTTLTEQIVSSHSLVAGAGEMDYWPRLARALTENYSAKLAKQLAENYILHLREQSATASRITDKMPGNYQNVGLIHAALPNAKFVHCRRHPIDACLSIYFQNFPDGHAYKWDLESLVVFYEQYIRIMEHWRSVLPVGTMFEFWYEDMVEDTEGMSKKLMDFLGLEWEPGQLEFYKQDRAVFTASKWQARQPIYQTSKERWRHYEQFIEPLLPLLKYAPNA